MRMKTQKSTTMDLQGMKILFFLIQNCMSICRDIKRTFKEDKEIEVWVYRKKPVFRCKSNSTIANVHLSVTETPQPLRIKPINHQAYWPLSLSTSSGLLLRLLSLFSCYLSQMSHFSNKSQTFIYLGLIPTSYFLNKWDLPQALFFVTIGIYPKVSFF